MNIVDLNQRHSTLVTSKNSMTPKNNVRSSVMSPIERKISIYNQRSPKNTENKKVSTTKNLFTTLLSKLKRNNANTKNLVKLLPQDLGLHQVSEFEILQRI